jgi:two-component system, cell cycle sensor histidine kinase and response regulator CckA
MNSDLIDNGTDRILLVEDEATLRELSRVILLRSGYQVLEAASGVQALAVWDQSDGQIDLLLTDIVMQDGLDGIQLADELAARKPSLKVVYTSGSPAYPDGSALKMREGSLFLQKPFLPEQLIQIVQASLSGDRDPAAAENVSRDP